MKTTTFSRPATWAAGLLALTLGLGSLRTSAQTALTVNPAQTLATARPEHYGLNFQSALDPAVAANAAYKARVAELQPKLVRYHAAEQIFEGNAMSWIDFGTRTWNKAKINSVLQHRPATATDVLITISGWPSWMDVDDDDQLDANQQGAYAAFCADLVDIVNNQLGYGVKYWEPFNEKDGGAYQGATDMVALADIFKQCHQAMKAKDASIKLVGGAWRQPWDGDIDHFLQHLGGGYLDVWSHHNYGGGDQTDPVQLYNNAHLEWGVGNVRGKLNAKGYAAVPIWLDEWNIFWSWDSNGYWHMTNNVGAVYDALVYKYILEAGQTAALLAWNAADGRYGKIKADYSGLTPGGELLKLLRQYAVGDVVSSTSANDTKLEGLTVKNGPANKMTFVIINKSQTAENVSFSATGWNPTSDAVEKKEISATGFAQSTVSWAQAVQGKTFAVPANSVTVLVASTTPVTTPGPIANGRYTLTARHSGQRLNVSGYSWTGEVIQWPASPGATNEQWTLTAVGNGYYTLTGVQSGKCLGIASGSTANGARALVVTCSSATSQRWKIVPTSGGYYKLTAQHSNKVLEVSGASQANAAFVQQYQSGTGTHQQWRLDPVSSARSQAAAPTATAATTLPDESAALRVYPNPTHGKATLALTAHAAQTTTVRVRTQQGQPVGQFDVALPPGRHEQRLPLALPAGTYYLSATIDGRARTFTLQVE